MKWWLVSEDTLTEVRFILGLGIKDPGQAESYKNAFRDALHTLEAGMHKTDAVPADYADSEPKVIRATAINAIRDKTNDDNPPQ